MQPNLILNENEMNKKEWQRRMAMQSAQQKGRHEGVLMRDIAHALKRKKEIINQNQTNCAKSETKRGILRE